MMVRTPFLLALSLVSVVLPSQGRLNTVAVTVVTTEAEPIVGATVSIERSGRSDRRVASTGRDGVAAFAELPNGRYTLSAEKVGFVALAFGAKRHDQEGASLVLTGGMELRDLRITLPRTASIEGIVLLPDGRPAVQSTVSIARLVVNPDDGQPQFLPLTVGAQTARLATATSADGRFRLFGIPPGRVAVRARAPHDPLNGTSFGYTYYPGTLERSEATLLDLEAGQAAEVTLRLQLPARIEILSRVSGADRSTVFEARISAGPFPNTGESLADGTFRFSNVTPGRHSIEVRTASPVTPNSIRQWGRAEVVVAPGQQAAVDVLLQPGLHIHGRTEGDWAGRAAPHFRVVLRPLYPWQGTAASIARSDDAGKFVLPYVPPGRYRAIVENVEPETRRWTVDTVLFGDADVTDVPFIVEPVDTRQLLVRLTDRVQRIVGTIVHPGAREVVPDVFVILHSAESRHWVPLSRRVRYTRPASDGSFEFDAVPAGSYRIAAVTDFAPDELYSPEFLATLAVGSTEVRLLPGETKTLVLAAAR